MEPLEIEKLTGAVLYPIRLDMQTGFPALADEAEAKIIFDYLNERNLAFGTVLELDGDVMKVKLHDLNRNLRKGAF